MVKTGQELPGEPKTVKTNEEKPYNYADPVQVGQEFIRQYYRVLNECPEYLFRFYNNQSSFVHGGTEKLGQDDPVIRGQRAIREKIRSLNFVNSQVKIFQMDSQQSHADTVVIQASGEINRDGVMRRFMQSFILARQGSFSFCVHNDIFRYQDEDFSSEKEQSSEEQQAAQEGTESDMSEEAVDMPVAMDAPADPEMSPVAIVGDSPESSEAQSLPTVEQNEVEEEEQPAATKEEEEEEEEKEVEASSPVTEEEQKEEKEAEPQSPKAPEKPKEESSEPSAPQPAESVKTFSWAALVSKNTTPAASSSEVPPVAAPPKPVAKAERKPSGAAASADAAKPQEPPKTQRTQRESHYSRERSNSSRGEERNGGPNRNGNGGRNFPFGSNYPDDQQLFVGNLPHSMSESELTTFFEGFGKVLELRINTKGAGGRVPNFGFVIFDNMETAQNVLRQRPVFYNGHRLNVEEKKTRGGARWQGPPRNGGYRGGYRPSRPYNDRQNGGREFYKRGASNAAARH